MFVVSIEMCHSVLQNLQIYIDYSNKLISYFYKNLFEPSKTYMIDICLVMYNRNMMLCNESNLSLMSPFQMRRLVFLSLGISQTKVRTKFWNHQSVKNHVNHNNNKQYYIRTSLLIQSDLVVKCWVIFKKLTRSYDILYLSNIFQNIFDISAFYGMLII